MSREIVNHMAADDDALALTGDDAKQIYQQLERQQAEIERIRTRLGDADRHTIQAALMPFHHRLPAHLRGPNIRLEDPA